MTIISDTLTRTKSFFTVFSWPGRKLGKLGNLRKLEKIFPRFLNAGFRFWLKGKIENLEIRKLGLKFPGFPRFSSFPSFRPGRFPLNHNKLFPF